MGLPQAAASAVAPEQGIVRVYSFLDPSIGLLQEAQQGLGAARKVLPARWRYDSLGLRALDALISAPEFYLVRHERALLVSHLPECMGSLPRQPLLVDLGPACSLQAATLVDALQPPLYLPVTVDEAAARAVAARLSESHPSLHIAGMLAEPTRPLVLPSFSGFKDRGRLVFLSALSGGSYTPDELGQVLRCARLMAGAGGAMLAGVDLKKSRKLLEAAGNDAQGLAARWNAGLLQRLNRELGADFQPARFHHVAVHNEMLSCTGFYLESDYAQFAHLDGRRHDFAAGEAMLTGIASQYSPTEFEALAVEAGFKVEKMWTDAARWMALCLLTAA